MSANEVSRKTLAGFQQGFGVSILLLGVLLAPVAVAEETDRSGPTVAAALRDDDPKVCKRLIPTGSRIARRICLPRSEWDAMRVKAQQAARDTMQQEAQVRYGPG